MSMAQSKKLRLVTPDNLERNLAQFSFKVQEYRRFTGNTQKELADALSIHPKVLSRKLSPNSDAPLTNPEVKLIVKTLAGWRALVSREEAIELLELMGLRADAFSEEEWDSSPLDRLYSTGLEAVETPPAPATPLVGLSITPPPLHNLPARVNRFIGRTRSVERLSEILEQDHVRLITLLGPGGVGKTRLSLEVAWRSLSKFEHGVWFVPLAGVSDSEVLAASISQALGIRENKGTSPLQDLKNYLQPRKILLVLDNFEQLVDAALVVGELLGNAPGLKILVTSRVILHLYGELEFTLAPLDLPDPQNLQNLAESEAVRLFVERVQSIDPEFQLDAENGPTIVRICARLDGLPLALELAAARTRLFSLLVLLEQLSRASLEVLTGGARNLPDRHRTLRNTLEWSYRLLEPEEQRLIARLSVFRGGWTWQAAQAVSALPGHNDYDTLDILNALLEKSLLVSEVVAKPNQPDSLENRYSMLETVREYALECLAGNGELDQQHRQHLDYYQKLGEQSEKALRGPEQARWLAKLDLELNNFRAALAWATEFRPETSLDEKKSRISAGLKLATALFEFWNLRAYWSEGYHYLKQILAQGETCEVDPEILAKALSAASLLASSQGNYAEARQLAERGLKVALDSMNPAVAAVARNAAGYVAYNHADFELALSYFQVNLEIFRQLDDLQAVAITLDRIGNIYRNLGDYIKAKEFLRESLSIYRQLGNRYGQANVLLAIGHIANMERETETAQKYYFECIDIFRELGNKQGIANVLNGLGTIANHLGQNDDSKRYYHESLALFQEAGNKLGVCIILINLANNALSGGAFDNAYRYFHRALEMGTEMGDKLTLTLVLYRLGVVMASQEKLEEALAYYRESLKVSLEIGDRPNIAKVYRGMGDVAFLQRDYGTADKYFTDSMALAREIKNTFALSRTLMSAAILAKLQGDAGQSESYLQESKMIIEQMDDKQLPVQLLGAMVVVAAGTPGGETRAVRLAGALEKETGVTRQVLEPPIFQRYNCALQELKNKLPGLVFNAAWSEGQALTLAQALESEYPVTEH